MPEPRELQRHGARALSVVIMLLGVALIARTVAAGGGPLATGIILGVLFVLAGAGRLYLNLRGR